MNSLFARVYDRCSSQPTAQKYSEPTPVDLPRRAFVWCVALSTTQELGPADLSVVCEPGRGRWQHFSLLDAR